MSLVRPFVGGMPAGVPQWPVLVRSEIWLPWGGTSRRAFVVEVDISPARWR